MAGRGFRRPGTIVCGLRHNSLFQVDLKVEKGSSKIATGKRTDAVDRAGIMAIHGSESLPPARQLILAFGGVE